MRNIIPLLEPSLGDHSYIGATFLADYCQDDSDYKIEAVQWKIHKNHVDHCVYLYSVSHGWMHPLTEMVGYPERIKVKGWSLENIKTLEGLL